MNQLGKEQDSVFETLEKGNFVAPPGGDPRDEEAGSPLYRAIWYVVFGLLFASLLPGVWAEPLIPFLGAVLLLMAGARLWEESPLCKAVSAAAAVLAAVLSFRIIADGTFDSLPLSILYPICGYGALLLQAAIPALLALALKQRWLGLTAGSAFAMAVLWLFGGCFWAAAALAVCGLAGLVMTAVAVIRQEKR